LSPKVAELGIEFLNVVAIIDDNDILLVTLTSLEGPVERASKDEHRVNDHELVVHVILLRRVSSAWNTSIGHLLGVSSLAFHGLVIGNNSYNNSSFVSSEKSVRKVVIGERENGEVNAFLGLINVVNNFLHVFHVWEEKGISVSWLAPIGGILHLTDHLPESFENIFVFVV